MRSCREEKKSGITDTKDEDVSDRYDEGRQGTVLCPLSPPDGSIDEITAEVVERLPILSKGGGYVFDAIHNIVGNTKPESIWAAFKAVHDYNAKHFG